MDRIKIQNLEVFGHHGVFSEETKLGQKFLVNATMYTNTRAAGYSDDLEKSINYGTGYADGISAFTETGSGDPETMGTDRIASGKCIGGDQPRLAYSLSLCRFKSWRTPAVFAGSSETFAGMQ